MPMFNSCQGKFHSNTYVLEVIQSTSLDDVETMFRNIQFLTYTTDSLSDSRVHERTGYIISQI